MKSTATLGIKAAQDNLPRLARGQTVVGISRHSKVVGFYVPRERFEALLETMELLANPKAMKTLKADQAGQLKYQTLAAAEKNWGLK